MKRTGIQQLIDFVCEQEMDLEDYPLLKPMIDEHFDVEQIDEGRKWHIVETIIHWEQNRYTGSLEALLSRMYKATPK